MLFAELHEYGLENTLSDIRHNLECALESSSKNEKNVYIGKALGAAEALFYLVNMDIEKEEVEDEEEDDE